MEDRNRVTPPPVKAPVPSPKPSKQVPARAVAARQDNYFLDRMVQVNTREIRVLHEHYNVSDKLAGNMRALPAAAAVLGIVLGSAAEAQTVLGNASATVSLGSYNAGNIFKINGGTQIAAVGDGILGNSTGSWTITNFGDVASTANTGIMLQHGGVVDNAGNVAGAGAGIDVSGGAATIRNEATLAGAGPGYISGGVNGVFISSAGGTIFNGGMIIGNNTNDLTANGVSLVQGGAVTNAASGAIYGLSNGVNIQGMAGQVQNDGLIDAFGTAGTGIVLGAGGDVGNAATGTIFGGSIGLAAAGAGADVENAGGIDGEAYGVSLSAGGTVNNAAGSYVYGGHAGVSIKGGLGMIDNAGLITASSTGLMAVGLYQGGTVTNLSGGTISGSRFGVSAETAAVSLANSGTIAETSNDDGVFEAAVFLNDGGSVTNGMGAAITAHRMGVFIGDGAGVSNLTNSGAINAGVTGVGMYGGTIVNKAGGVITGGFSGAYLGSGGITNAAGGLISGGAYGVAFFNGGATLSNAGTISSGQGEAVALISGGSVTNQAGGVLAGAASGVAGSGPVSLDNAGSISASSGAGVVLSDGGSVTNEVTGRISGSADGVELPAGGNITNIGSITGTRGDGLVMQGGTLANLAGGSIRGGTDGVLAGDGAVIVNNGSLLDDADAGAVLGDKVVLLNGNTGLISGATGLQFTGSGASVVNAGTITGANGVAISFAPSGSNALTLTTGSVVNGAIDGAGSAGNIYLAGTGILASTIANFGTGSALHVQSGANWTASGNWAVANVVNDGSLQAGIIGTPLTLTGDYVQMPDGNLNIVVTPAASSSFIIHGTATLGGNVTYDFAPGTYAARSYNFISASGGLSGSFSSVTYDGALPPALAASIVDPVNVLELALAAPISAPATVPAVRVSPADDALFAAANQAAADLAEAADTSVLDHAAGPLAVTPCIAAPAAAADSAGTAAVVASGLAGAFCRAGGWVEATGGLVTADGHAAAPGYTADTSGVLAGIDKPVNDAGTRLGLVVGYDESWLHDNAAGKANTGTTRVGLYGVQPFGRFTLAATLLYGNAAASLHRQTGAGTASATPGSDVFAGGVQLGTALMLREIALTPSAGLRFAVADAHGFSETGAPAAFGVHGLSSRYASVQPFLSLDVSRQFTTPQDMVITPDARLGLTEEVADTGRAVAVVSADGTGFASPVIKQDRTAANLAAGVTAGRSNWVLFARYTADVSGNWVAQTGQAGLSVKF